MSLALEWLIVVAYVVVTGVTFYKIYRYWLHEFSNKGMISVGDIVSGVLFSALVSCFFTWAIAPYWLIKQLVIRSGVTNPVWMHFDYVVVPNKRKYKGGPMKTVEYIQRRDGRWEEE